MKIREAVVACAALMWAATSTIVSAQEVDARALLLEMNAEIAGLSTFTLSGDAYADARLDAGHIIEHASEVTMHLRREPSAVRVTSRSAEGTSEVAFNNGALTVYTSDQGYYAQITVAGGVDEFFEFAVDRAGVEVPLLDFISTNVADNMLDGAEEVRYLEKSLIRGDIYHHIGIRSSEIDVQVWVAAEGPPLPGKLSISSKWEGGAPRFVAFFKWDTAPIFTDGLFDFTPPEGAVEIEFLSEIGE